MIEIKTWFRRHCKGARTYEEDISTEQRETQKDTRFSRPNGYTRGSEGSKAQTGKRAQEANRHGAAEESSFLAAGASCLGAGKGFLEALV